MQQEADDEKARNTTLNTAKRASQAEDVRDPNNKRRLAPKPRQLMSTTAAIFFLFPNRPKQILCRARHRFWQTRRALQERMRIDLKQRCRLGACIGMLFYVPDWLFDKGGCAACFRAIIQSNPIPHARSSGVLT
jgi:hypothetical protein